MFCNRCGKQIPDGAVFCASCGAPANQQAAPAQPQAAPQAPAQPTYQAPAQQPYQQPYQPQPAANSMVNNFIATLKGVFSKDIVKTVSAQAQNNSNDWVISNLLSLLVFSVFLPVNILEMVNLIKNAEDSEINLKFPFFAFFGLSIVIGLIVLAVVAIGLRVVASVVTKKTISWNCVLNLVGAASLPLTACYLVNMILGLLWGPLTLVVSLCGVIMTMILLYIGLQKLEKPVASPFGPYALFTLVVVFVAFLAGYFLLKPGFETWRKEVFDFTGPYITGLLGLYDYLK